jgi:NTP pyrophosphatase (non-canonical NTP hydrolase)
VNRVYSPKAAFYANLIGKVKSVPERIYRVRSKPQQTGSTLMNEIEQITASLRQFRDERDWAQFHNAKDLALALSIEASELLELFLWKSAGEADQDKIKEELADVFAYALLLADKYGLDVSRIVHDKIEKNRQKYPVDKARGTAKKYHEL